MTRLSFAEREKAAYPNAAAHTEPPTSDYLGKQEWADRMMETHVQARCSGCGYYVIWTPKP